MILRKAQSAVMLVQDEHQSQAIEKISRRDRTDVEFSEISENSAGISAEGASRRL
jgi:hypothetical protein